MAIFQNTLLRPLFTVRRGKERKRYDLERIGKRRKGYSILVYSGSGGGKTTVSYQLMKEYIQSKDDEFGIYITFEQSAEDQEEALESVGVLREGEKAKILVVDEPYIMSDIADRYLRVKEAAEGLERKRRELGVMTGDPRVENEMVEPLRALKSERDRLIEVAKQKKFKLTSEKFQMLAEAILKNKFKLDDEQTRRVLEIGIGGRKPTEEDGIWYEVSQDKRLAEEYADLQRAIEDATKTLTMDATDYIEMEIETAIEDAMFGDLAAEGIPKGSKLGVVALDSLQIIESKLEIGEDEDKIRKLWGMYLRTLKEKFGVFIIGVLERRSGNEEANTLPEAYAFDCILEISVTREGRKNIFRDIRVVKARNIGHVQEMQPISFTDNGMFIGSIED